MESSRCRHTGPNPCHSGPGRGDLRCLCQCPLTAYSIGIANDDLVEMHTVKLRKNALRRATLHSVCPVSATSCVQFHSQLQSCPPHALSGTEWGLSGLTYLTVKEKPATLDFPRQCLHCCKSSLDRPQTCLAVFSRITCHSKNTLFLKYTCPECRPFASLPCFLYF